MKSNQNNPNTEENGPSGCTQESKPRGKSMQHISYRNKAVLKAGGFQAASPIPKLSWKKMCSKNLSHSFDYQTCCESQGSPAAGCPLLSTAETPWSAVPSSGLPRTTDTQIYWREFHKDNKGSGAPELGGEPESWDCSAQRGESSGGSHLCV